MANAGFENKAVDLARHFDEKFKKKVKVESIAT